MKHALTLTLCGLLITMAACDSRYVIPYQRTLWVFGTMVEVQMLGIDDARASKIADLCEIELLNVHQRFHAWEPSALTLLNQQLQQGETVSTTEEMHTLIAMAQSLYRLTQGYFNPAQGQLSDLWGFFSDFPTRERGLPDHHRLQQITAQRPTMEDIELTQHTVSSHNPNIQLDFGGFAKGYAIDKTVEQLKAAGVPQALVNAGGDLRGYGNMGHRPWRVAIRSPFHATAIGIIELAGDESVFTSGTYLRRFSYEGDEYHHIIDGRTGFPAKTGLVSVTVLHSQATLADAAATAMLVAGRDQALSLAQDMGVDKALLVTEDNEIIMTDAMRARIKLQHPQQDA